MIAVERSLATAWIDSIAILNGGLVIAARDRDVPRTGNRQRVSRVDAPGADETIQVHPRIEGLAIDRTARDATVGKRVHADDAPAGVQISQLRRLAEPHAASIVGGAGGDLIRRRSAERLLSGELTRGAGVVLVGG